MTAQIKRALANGIRELETCWELRQLPLERRFLKRQRGKWEVLFQRKTHRQKAREKAASVAKSAELEVQLARREVGPAMAADLVAAHPAELVQTMIELFDWYNSRGQSKSAGFLIDSIRNSAKYRFPAGFESSAQRAAHRVASEQRIRAQQQEKNRHEQKTLLADKARLEPFLDFWSGLTELERKEFEIRALTEAAPIKRDGYHRLLGSSSPAFEEYRQVILRDHFERLKRDRVG